MSPLGYTLNLAVDPSICLAVTTSSSNTVQWCTVQKDTAGQRFGVYRTISGNCNASDAVFQVDFVTKPDIWSMVCPTSQLQAVSVDMPVNRDPVTRAGPNVRAAGHDLAPQRLRPRQLLDRHLTERRVP